MSESQGVSLSIIIASFSHAGPIKTTCSILFYCEIAPSQKTFRREFALKVSFTTASTFFEFLLASENSLTDNLDIFVVSLTVYTPKSCHRLA